MNRLSRDDDLSILYGIIGDKEKVLNTNRHLAETDEDATHGLN
jgi:hypothetical protein